MKQSSGITDITPAIRLFGEVLDANATGLLVQNSTANLVVNATALRILGVSEATLLGMPPGAVRWQAQHADGRPLAHKEFPNIRALHSKRPVNDQVFGLVEQSGGQLRWISMSAVPMPETPEREALLYCFIKDVSESVQREERANRGREEAQVASHLKDDFLEMLSHELRTPLNSLMGMLQLALHSRNRESTQEYLTVALESSKHMLLLLGDISEISSGDTASLQVKQETFELEGITAPTIASFATSAASKGLKVSCQIDPKLPKRMRGDPWRIRQILFNLLANAVRQTERGGVSIVVSQLADHDSLQRYGLHILVKAAGAGKMSAPPSASGQADDAPRHHAEMGLGLSIAKHLVKILGGEIALSPRQDEVQVLLPLQTRQETQQTILAKERGEEAVPQSDAAKILVVEDEPINLKTMLLSLQLLGCQCVGADSAYKGLALLRKEKFDVVLMDIQMPGLDGLEATRLIRSDTSGALDSGIPIVAITAHAMQGDRERILRAGVDEYLAKPVYLEQLRAVLSTILKRPLELKTE